MVMNAAHTPSPSLGRCIRLARKSKGLTQTDLAELMSAPQSTVSLWEHGKTTPRFADCIALAEALEVDLAAFVDAVKVDEARQ
jgi:transcriptional regulator with XRE-family HTH domain